MYLIYTDETGTNNHPNIPFSLYGGLVVHESSVLKFEMQIIEIIQEFLGFKNMLEAEVHFTEIFNYVFHNKKPSKPRKFKEFEEDIFPLIENKTKKDVTRFIAELFQLISKANIPFFFSIIDKRDEYHKHHYLGNEEISHNAYAFKGFINIVDRFLTEKQEMGLLVADDFSNQIPKKLKQLSSIELISDKTIKENPNVKEIVYKRVLAESLVWKNRFLKDAIPQNSIAPLKYKFESNSFNLIDNINFVSSKESILNQISDVLLYVVRKIKEYNLNKEAYPEVKFFCEDKDLLASINFSYTQENIKEASISSDDSGLDITISSGVFSSISRNIL